MNNNKDFSDQIGDLFEELSLDEATNLVEGEVKPSKEDLRKEVIDNIKKTDIKIDKKILSELRNKDNDDELLDYLRESYDLKVDNEVREELEEVGPTNEIREVETVEPEKGTYVDDLSQKLANVLSQKGMRSEKANTTPKDDTTTLLEQRVDAIHTQLNMLRGTVMEGTMVSGIGAHGDGGSPGSGEVLLHRLDDVDIQYKPGTFGLGRSSQPDVEHGDILVWDSSLKDGYGAWTTTSGGSLGGGGGGNPNGSIIGAIWSCNYFGNNAPLYVDTKVNYGKDINDNTPTGTELYASVQSFDYVISNDAVKDDDGNYTGTWFVVGAEQQDGTKLDPVSFTGVSHPTSEGDPILGVYFRDGTADGNCGVVPPEDNIEDLVVGTITGCNEISSPGNLLWGTNNNYLDLIDPNAVAPTLNFVTDENDDDITNALRVISCVAKKQDASTPPTNWEVLYLDDERQPHIGYYTYDDSHITDPVEGPFLYSNNTYCVGNSGGTNRVTTADVVLAKNDPTGYSSISDFSILNQLPIDALDFTTQEKLNEVFFDIDVTLHKLKPTIICAPYAPADPTDETKPNYNNIDKPLLGGDTAYENYIPIKGDLWLDKDTFTLRGCTEVNMLPSAHGSVNFVATWQVISGDSAGNTTRDVTLYNTIELYTFYKDNIDPTLDAADFAELFALVTQENANIFNLDLLKKLNENKPTIHVTEDIFSITETFTYRKQNLGYDPTDPNSLRYTEEKISDMMYVPRKGDIWIDSTDYTMYVADNNNENKVEFKNPGNNLLYPYQNDDGTTFLYWVEVGSAGGGGSKVYIQSEPPTGTVQGDLWIEDTTYYVYVYSNETWVALTGDSSALGKNFRIDVLADPPSDPELGDCWYSIEDSELRIYIINTSNNISTQGLEPGWYPVSTGGKSIDVFQENTSTFAINFQIQELNARLQALENNTGEVLSESNNLSYPLSDDQLELFDNTINTVFDQTANSINQSSY